MKNILLVIPLLFMLGACTELQSVPGHQQHKLVELSDVVSDDYVLENLYPEYNLTLGFDEAGRVFGYSGLNRFFGKAKVEDGTIQIKELASTKMSGPREAIIREAQYMGMLTNMTKINVKDGKLILSNDNGEILIFKAK